MKTKTSSRFLFILTLLFASSSMASDPVKLSYMPEEEQGWGYIRMEINDTELNNIKNMRFVLYNDQGMKIAMTYLNLKPASHFLVNSQFKGKYQLVINRLQSNGLWMDDAIDLNPLIPQ